MCSFRFPSPVRGSSKLDECSPSGVEFAVASPQQEPSLPCADTGAIVTAAIAESASIEPNAAMPKVAILFEIVL